MNGALVRIDDVGGLDHATADLLGGLTGSGLTITCGVVPAWLTRACTSFLQQLAETNPGQIEVHQHGWCHHNHATTGRKQEFGAQRPEDVQRQEITRGREILQHNLRELFFPAFSPPFGNYEPPLKPLLRDLGFLALTGLWGDDDPTTPPSVSPLVDPLDWDPPRTRPWREVQTRWAAQERRDLLGIVLHPRFMSAGDIATTVRALPGLIGARRPVTLRQALAERRTLSGSARSTAPAAGRSSQLSAERGHGGP